MIIKSQNQIKTGLRSIELYYEPVYSTQLFDVVAYRTHLRINDPDLGVLLPEQINPVALRSNQAIRLTQWALEEIARSYSVFQKREVYCEWISVSIPVRFLKQDDFLQQIEELLHRDIVDREKIRFEFTSDLLYEESSFVNMLLLQLKDLGIRSFISGFGTEFCPIMRIGDFNVDGVMIDESVIAGLGSESKMDSLLSVVTMLKLLYKYIVWCGVSTPEIAESAVENEIPAYTGKIVGKHHRISGIR